MTRGVHAAEVVLRLGRDRLVELADGAVVGGRAEVPGGEEVGDDVAADQLAPVEQADVDVRPAEHVLPERRKTS